MVMCSRLSSSSENPTAVISLKLFHDATLSMFGDPCLGALQIRLDELFNLCTAEGGSKDASLQIVGVEGISKGKTAGILVVHIESVTQAQAKAVSDDVQSAVVASGLGSGNLATRAADIVSGLTDAATSADPLTSALKEGMTSAEALVSGLKEVMHKLDRIVQIGDQLSQIHPYANAAWKILTFVYEVVKKQQETDDKALQLVQAMVEVYSFVEDVDFLSSKIKPLENVVQEIIRQTVECAIFIREYVARGFSGRLQRDTLSNTNQKIDGLSEALRKLKDSFDHGLAVQSVFFSAKTTDGVESLVQSYKLKALNPLNMDASLRSECLPGTRQDVVTCVTEWLLTASESANILWLHGVAGAGKSTISITVSEYFRDLHRLGAFLCFDRNNTVASSPGGVIGTIAHQLANSDAQIRAAICNAITADATYVNAPLRTQFRKLLLDPLLRVAAEDRNRGPIVVVLDALDECGDADSRQALVSLIVDEFHNIPSVFRFLITSRPDSDIAGHFFSRSHIHPMVLDITTESTKSDIVAYLNHNMRTIRSDRNLELDWPGDHVIETLAVYSGGLFIWAVTACKFIGGFDPKEQLATILAAGVADDLDELYTVALRNSANWSNETFASTARSVLAAIVLGREPLTDSTIDKFLGLEAGRTAKVLEYLRCLVQWSPGQYARILHASFSDYLTDPQRSGRNPWFFYSKIQSRSLALGCLRILNSQLHFNICGLEDSCVPNAGVPDLASRIEKHIPAELKYASLFWSHHLHETDPDDEILVELKHLMYRKFLYWLEVLSLLNKVPMANGSLEVMRAYIEADEAFGDFLRDALRFLAVFTGPIALSAPHIYISAISLAPRKSLIRKQFQSTFPPTLHFTGSLGDDWMSLLKVLYGHFGLVSSVAFSPDDEKIVSGGSEDGMVMVWDSGTRDILGGLEGNTAIVNSVAFSPDGRQIVAGTGTQLFHALVTAQRVTPSGPPIIPATYTVVLSADTAPEDKDTAAESEPKSNGGLYLWDSKTGTLVAGPFGESDILSVAFSPDCKQVITGSYDGVVRLWDLTTFGLVRDFSGHTSWVLSVSVSADGTRIASGSADETIRVWDTATSAVVAGPLYTSDWPVSLSFSPDGRFIAFGSLTRGSLRIWEPETSSLTTFNETSSCVCLAFSPDGTRIVACSDKILYVWDSKTGSLLAGPFEGHTNSVTSVAFSSDGRRILSGSDDHSVRVWDAEIGTTPASEQFSGHLASVQSVDFSPDGKKIVSTSMDKAVQVWDSKTGALIAGPLSGASNVMSVSLASDGKRIACGSMGGAVLIWNYETGAIVKVFEGYSNAVMTVVAFSPEGDQIISGSGTTLHIWDSKTGDLISRPFERHTADIVSVSSNGQRIASASVDATVRIWDAKNGLSVAILEHPYCVRSVAFSPDGKKLVSGCNDGAVRVYDVETGGLVAGPFQGHDGRVASVTFSPDGKRVASGSDSIVRLWDSESGAVLARSFEGHTASINSLAFSPDGTRIVSGSWDSTIRVWELNDETLPEGWERDPHFEDGWMMDSASNLILWIPPWLRKGLLMPRNSLLICSGGTTTLNLAQFVHGTNWRKCIDPDVRDTTGK
ncbi:hypothetical protein B0H19DRAFT_1168004 [Mycena capillaripes]|nr:hypothetical protein B0H19DRAFT_1168004 [Mycena capillaripes]